MYQQPIGQRYSLSRKQISMINLWINICPASPLLLSVVLPSDSTCFHFVDKRLSFFMSRWVFSYAQTLVNITRSAGLYFHYVIRTYLHPTTRALTAILLLISTPSQLLVFATIQRTYVYCHATYSCQFLNLCQSQFVFSSIHSDLQIF